MQGDIIYVVRWVPESMGIKVRENQKEPLKETFLTYRHYGVDVGDGTVVQFVGNKGTSLGDVIVKRTSMEVFLDGTEKYIEEAVPYKFTREEVVTRAISMIDSKFDGYDFADNNCEHFCYWCAIGERYSRQFNVKSHLSRVINGIRCNTAIFLFNLTRKFQ